MANKRYADLSPPLGFPGGPCHVFDRIQEEIEHPAVAISLANKVQQGLDITNPEAHKVYSLQKERGIGFIRGLLITPHAQYRMDLRSVTVSELRLFFVSFQRYLERVRQKSPSEYNMFAKRLQFGEEINWTDPKLKLTVVFYTDRQAIAKIITTYWQGDADPKPVSCGANRRSPINRYATLVEDMTGYQTYVSQNPASSDSSPMDSATTTFYNSQHDFGPVGINTQDSSSETYNATPGRGLVDGERYMDNVIRRTNPNRRRMQEDDAGRVTASRRRADLNQQYSGQFIFGPSDIDPEFQGYPSASNSLSPQFPHKQIGDNTPVFTDPHAPGSAKVIPYVTDTEFANRMAAKSSEILQGLDPKVVAKAMSIKPKLTRVDKKNRMWTFTVPSAKEGDYTVKVKGGGNAVYAPKMDLKISCTCKDWVYGGSEHWAQTEGYLYGKPQGTAEAPKVRDSGGLKRVCKHVAAVLQKLEGYSMGASKKASKFGGSYRYATPFEWGTAGSPIFDAMNEDDYGPEELERMPPRELIRAIQDGRGANADLSGMDLENKNFLGARLMNASLDGTNLAGANLSSANLENATLYGTDLEGANLENATLDRAELTDTNLRYANLQNVSFFNARIRNVNMEGADLRGANLAGSMFSGTVKLKGVKYDHRTKWPRGFTPPPSI